MVIPKKMNGVLLTGHGGFDKLEWHEDLGVPEPGEGEVLIRVLASSVNNTDINTRTAWYSKSVRGDTASVIAKGSTGANAADGGWSGEPISFPRIQGADCCGEIVAVGARGALPPFQTAAVTNCHFKSQMVSSFQMAIFPGLKKDRHRGRDNGANSIVNLLECVQILYE